MKSLLSIRSIWSLCFFLFFLFSFIPSRSWQNNQALDSTLIFIIYSSRTRLHRGIIKQNSKLNHTKTLSMNIDSKEWVWLQIRGFPRLDHPSMMVSLCLGRRTTSLHHQQLHHHHLRSTKHMGMGTPLGNCQAWGSAPVSYHHHTPIFTVFHSSILLVISRSSRIKFWYQLVLSFALWSLYLIESVCYL